MVERPDMYIWRGKWSLPEGFGSKKEFRKYLGKNDFLAFTGVHHSEKNGLHFDILQYAENGGIRKKSHCILGNEGIGNSIVKCLQNLNLEPPQNVRSF